MLEVGKPVTYSKTADMVKRSYPVPLEERKEALNIAGVIPDRIWRETVFQLDVLEIPLE